STSFFLLHLAATMATTRPTTTSTPEHHRRASKPPSTSAIAVDQPRRLTTDIVEATFEVAVACNVDATSKAINVDQQIYPETTPSSMTPSHVAHRHLAMPIHA
ncbi:hypothetical protein Dimus_005387, partial [Dionaea muscipula]